jgi:hypothetical protein
MKNVMMALVLTFALASSAGCSAKPIAAGGGPGVAKATVSAQPQTASLKEIPLHADYAVRYESIASLVASSGLVVHGEVQSVDYVDFNTVTYSRVKVKVLRAFGAKDKPSPGSTIIVAEPGGVTTVGALSRYTEFKQGEPTATAGEPASTKVQVLFDGMPLAKPGDQVLYFLAPGTLGVVSEPYYDVVGASQGKFFVSGGVAQRHVASWESGAMKSLSTALPALLGEVTREAATK